MAYKNPQDQKLSKKSWRERNRKWLREYSRRNILKYKFGITLEEKVAMWEAQNRKCANPNCLSALRDPRKPKKCKQAACVDHNHRCCSSVKTCGQCIRGLLCHSCNAALGQLKDDVKRILGLISYLRRWQ